MRKFLGIFPIFIILASCATTPVPATKLQKANVLPLALDDDFQFRKVKLFYYQPVNPPRTESEPVNIEHLRLAFGAITRVDTLERLGNYFTFFWRATREADVTLRLEYRQASLGNYVMAQERYYPAEKGSFESDFTVIGDDYSEFGEVTAWRALLIVDGRIVGLRQSFMWK